MVPDRDEIVVCATREKQTTTISLHDLEQQLRREERTRFSLLSLLRFVVSLVPRTEERIDATQCRAAAADRTRSSYANHRRFSRGVQTH
jgi:hypothetical protein